MVSSSLLQNIIASVLIGTERQSFTPITTDGNLGKLLDGIANIDPNDREIALLNRLAAIAFYELAGKIPVKNRSVLPNVCDLDNKPKVIVRLGGDKGKRRNRRKSINNSLKSREPLPLTSINN